MDLEDAKYGRNDESEEIQRETLRILSGDGEWNLETANPPPPERREIFIILGKKRKSELRKRTTENRSRRGRR